MQSNQIIIINGTLRVIGAFLLLSRRAHLLTTAKTRRVLVSGGISTFVETVRSPRVAAPLEPCGSCQLPCGCQSDNRIVNAVPQP